MSPRCNHAFTKIILKTTRIGLLVGINIIDSLYKSKNVCIFIIFTFTTVFIIYNIIGYTIYITYLIFKDLKYTMYYLHYTVLPTPKLYRVQMYSTWQTKWPYSMLRLWTVLLTYSIFNTVRLMSVYEHIPVWMKCVRVQTLYVAQVCKSVQYLHVYSYIVSTKRFGVYLCNYHSSFSLGLYAIGFGWLKKHYVPPSPVHLPHINLKKEV